MGRWHGHPNAHTAGPRLSGKNALVRHGGSTHHRPCRLPVTWQTSLSYFTHKNDYWTQKDMQSGAATPLPHPSGSDCFLTFRGGRKGWSSSPVTVPPRLPLPRLQHHRPLGQWGAREFAPAPLKAHNLVGRTAHACNDTSASAASALPTAAWNLLQAYGLNGTGYEEFLFQERMLTIIQQHDPAEPLFLWYRSWLPSRVGFVHQSPARNLLRSLGMRPMWRTALCKYPRIGSTASASCATTRTPAVSRPLTAGLGRRKCTAAVRSTTLLCIFSTGVPHLNSAGQGR
jgi:hypothetical protein